MNNKHFLSQLLKPENTVPADDGQECMICQEEYGKRTGAVDTAERQIRLPCNPKHTVGSNCIVTWLKANNTCPICRYEFFPKEKKSNIDRERAIELFVSLLEDEDEDVVDQDEDTEDEDFVDAESETDDEDVNMSDEDEE